MSVDYSDGGSSQTGGVTHIIYVQTQLKTFTKQPSSVGNFFFFLPLFPRVTM